MEPDLSADSASDGHDADLTSDGRDADAMNAVLGAGAFAGWLRTSDDRAQTPRDLAARLTALSQSLGAGHVISTDALALVSTAPVIGAPNPGNCAGDSTTTPVATEAPAIAVGESDDAPGPLIALAGEPYCSDDGPRSDREHLADTLLRACRATGTVPADQLRGHFAMALINRQAGRVVLRTDRMARVPLYYAQDAGGIYFGTSAQSLRTLCDPTPAINPQGLYNYVYFHMIPAPDTVYRGMNKLRAASEVTLTIEPSIETNSKTGGETSVEARVETRTETGDKASRERRYWSPTFREHADRSRDDLHGTLRQRLRAAVQTSAAAGGRAGAFLSGGLDSSTVAGMLSEVQDGPTEAYAIGFEAEGYDEMPYARITAEHFGIRLHEYYVTPQDVLEALPAIAASADEPFGNSSVLPAWFCARMAARDGVDTLLAGDGGDELFAGNERYAKDKAFQLYTRLPGWFRSGLLEPLTLSLPAGLPLQGKAKSYIEQARVRLPDRMQAYNFLHRNAPDSVFTPAFLEQVSTAYPLQLLRETFNDPADAGDLNRMLYLDWQITLADNDLRKVNRACEMAGVSVRYPMLDDALVEFSTAIPSQWKLPGRTLRDFYKRALAGWLPQATLDKEKHGFGLPFGVWMRSYAPLSEMAYDCVLRLKHRDIFREDFLDRAIALHRADHAAYYGSLIWILTALELWLEANA